MAEALRAEVVRSLEAGRRRGWPAPTLASVHLDAGTPYAFYLDRQRRAAEELGIAFRAVPLRPPADAAVLARILEGLESDPSVHGIIVEHPLPAGLDFHGALDRLSPEKDVDGVGVRNLGALLSGRPGHAPAVARAAIALARHYGLRLEGRPVAVLGRSATVGLPLALLLLARGAGGDATVTVAHSRTADLRAALAGSEVIFSCVGRPGLLGRENVPKGAAVIDVGVSSVPDPQRPGGSRIAGDADPAALEGWAGALTPVPGGVGPVTVAQLMANTIDGWVRQLGRGSG